jgi:membrane protease YdiL (CAAX protease family)
MESIPTGEPSETTETGPFWSPWATVAWGLLIISVFVLGQGAIVIVWSVMRTAAGAEPEDLAAEFAAAGDLLSVATLASAIVCSVLVFVILAIGRGIRPGTAVALTRPPGRSLALWLAITAGLIVVSDTLTTLLGKPIVPEFMADLVRNATMAPLLWLAIIIAAPFFEELFVRGFLLEGLRRGALGDAGAIVLTSVFWASIHIQYGLYEIGTIFVFGIALGLARIGSRSLWVPIAMHMLANLVATVEAHLLAPP